MVADWLFREQLPVWLDLVPSLRAYAEKLRKAAEIVDASRLQPDQSIVLDAQDAVGLFEGQYDEYDEDDDYDQCSNSP